MMWTIIVFVSLTARLTNAECSYDCEENSIETSGDSGLPIAPGLPPSTVLGGKVVKLDDIAPTVFLNRTKAWLNCASGIMQIDLKFEEPFIGIVYADFDRSSRSCAILGTGETTARIELPLKGCGTKQDPVRVFTNNLVVRFHQSLEMDGDEVITIVCRYPPPIAPPPPPPPEPLKVPPPGPVVDQQPLKGFQILLIICGILFLSLVLFGLAMSYYCLKNQRIRVVRKYPAIKDAESLKGGSSSVDDMSVFDTLKIPRAHALTPTTMAGSTGSEETVHGGGSETLPSDYPSETPSTAHSEAEDIDSRRRSISSAGSFDNKAYVPDVTLLTREQLLRRNETEVETHETTSRFRPPPPEPKFDVQMRIKKPPLPSPSPSIISSDTELSTTTINRETERNLLTVDEQSYELSDRRLSTPPVYSEVARRSRDKTVPLPSTTWRSEYEMDTVDRLESNRYAEQHYNDIPRKRTELTVDEPPLVPSRRPEITSHIVDDVFLRTITEKKTIEDIERHRRQVTEYGMTRPQLPTIAPKWDVVIRNYPNPNAQTAGSGDETATDWESFSESSSVYGIPISSSDFKLSSSSQQSEPKYYRSQVEKRYAFDVPIPDPTPPNWEALVSVLEYRQSDEDVTSVPPERHTATMYRTEKTLTLDDRKKWRKIITTESTLRTLLTEATVKEDYERIRRDRRYEKLFEPESWEIIIRILTSDNNNYPSSTSANGPDNDSGRLFDQRAAAGNSGVRYRKKAADWDSRSSNRRSSLPTLYEYDSDGSSIRNLNLEATQVGTETTFDPYARSRRTSRSSIRSDIDVRSMSEVTVNFARQEVPDNVSEASSSYYRIRRFDDDDDEDDVRSLVRSVSQPSLARSASEFTENWGIRDRNWDLSSPEHSPRSSMRSKKSGNQQTAATSSSLASFSGGSNVKQRQYQQTSSRQRQLWYKDKEGDDNE